MELKNFISDTLIQIAEGVKDSQSRYKELGGKVVPKGFRHMNGNINWGKENPMNGDASILCDVSFEVALKSGEKSNEGAGVSVLFGAIGLGGKHEGEINSTSLTSVKFNIPVSLPQQ